MSGGYAVDGGYLEEGAAMAREVIFRASDVGRRPSAAYLGQTLLTPLKPRSIWNRLRFALADQRR